MTTVTTVNKCPVCHGDLPDPKAVCPGRIPGPLGLVAFSPGPCLSTPADRERLNNERVERAQRQREKEF